jgi:hypothetical protein
MRRAWTALTALTLCACTPREEPPAPQALPRLLELGPAPRPDRPPVRLLEAGAEPRAALRYNPAPEGPRSLELTLEVTRWASAGGLEAPAVTLPPLRLRLGLEPSTPQEDGSLRLAFRLEEAEAGPRDDAPPALLESVGADLAGLKGLTGAWVVDPRGPAREGEVEPSAGTAFKLLRDEAEELRQQLLGLVVPLPAEPVGLGARWEARREIAWVWMRLGTETHAFRGQQTATYRLTGLDEERLQLELELTRVFPSQALLGGQEIGPAAKLESMETRGSGRLRVNLAALLPIASLELTTQRRMTAQRRGPGTPGETSTSTTRMKMTAIPR